MKRLNHAEPRAERPAPPRRIGLRAQILSGLASMLATMGVLAATMPPEDISDSGAIALAAASPHDERGGSAAIA